MSELELWQQAGLGTASGVGGVMLLFKLISFIKKEQESQAGTSATAAQFKVLQEQIGQNHGDILLLREQMNKMDITIHKQQRTIPRMEMLLRQFSGPVSQKGIEVPTFMQAELEELIVPDVERQA